MANHDVRIDDLLDKVSDPVLRSVVVVLGSINRDMQEQIKLTTRLVESVEGGNAQTAEVDRKLTDHIVDEGMMVAGFRGQAQLAVWVGPALFTILGLLGGYIWMGQASALREAQIKMEAIREQQVINTEWLRNLDRRQSKDEGNNNK